MSRRFLESDSGRIYVSGMISRARRLDQCFDPRLRGLRLKAGSIPRFFGMPSSALLDQIVPLAELSSPQGRRLAATAMQADSIDDLVERVVADLAMVCQRTAPDRRLLFALSQIDFKPLRDIAS